MSGVRRYTTRWYIGCIGICCRGQVRVQPLRCNTCSAEVPATKGAQLGSSAHQKSGLLPVGESRHWE
jgi:hypothetical protein